MAITRSSRAITSTEPPRRGARATVVVSAVAACVGLTGGSAPVVAQKGPDAMTTSFFEPFDKLDERRWYVSDGWVIADWHGCTWSRQAARVSGGMLRLQLFKASNKYREYKCGEVKTKARLGYGWYEARIRTAAGSGLNTAMFTYSGPPLTKVHDEVDFEFLGKSPTKVQLNYYIAAKGGRETLPDLGFDASKGFHIYAFEWTPDRIRWFVDGRLVRTATGALPQVSGQFFVSLWNGGKGVDDWLGRADPARIPASADIDWIAYTRSGERCRFPESTSCRFM